MSDYKTAFSFEHRLNESTRIKDRFPDRIPVIVQNTRVSNLPLIDKNKFLVPKSLTIGQFIFVIRRRIIIPPEKAMFLFINNSLPLTSSFISEVYANHRDTDGFLYCFISGENTFGNKYLEFI